MSLQNVKLKFMKKNFDLTSPVHKPDRQIEFVKHDINKYIARERRKALPIGIDFWDFNCKCGPDVNSAVSVHISEIGKQIDHTATTGAVSVYVEIIAKPGVRNKNS